MEAVAFYFNNSYVTFHVPRNKSPIKAPPEIYPSYNEKGLTVLSKML